MIRKPDPPVLVAVASEPPSRIRNGTVQILDYNLNRCVQPRPPRRNRSTTPKGLTSKIGRVSKSCC